MTVPPCPRCPQPAVTLRAVSRSESCVTFRPVEVSRRHFKITQDRIDAQPVYFITDLGSTCGTYLNGALLEAQKEMKVPRGLPGLVYLPWLKIRLRRPLRSCP